MPIKPVIAGGFMGRKSGKKIDLRKVDLTEGEKKAANKKALLTIVLCISWPFTLILLMPNIRELVSGFIYYLILFVAAMNVYLTIGYTRTQIDDLKYQAYLAQNRIGNVERFAGLIFIVEVIIIGMFLFYVRKLVN